MSEEYIEYMKKKETKSLVFFFIFFLIVQYLAHKKMVPQHFFWKEKPVYVSFQLRPIFFYHGILEKYDGFEMSLLNQFFSDNNYSRKPIFTPSSANPFSGKTQIELGNLNHKISPSKSHFVIPIFAVPQSLVCHWRTKLDSRNLVDALQIRKKSALSQSESILKRINNGSKTCTLLNRFEFEFYARAYPNIRYFAQFEQNVFLSWKVSKNYPELARQLTKWSQKQSLVSQIHLLNEKKSHFSFNSKFDLKIFRYRLKSLLPKYKRHFKSFARRWNIPWELIAAVAYQESHWNPKAKSFTGVRGLMMLTLVTAKETGVKNRLDPVQSIWGGVKYLKGLYGRLHKVKDKDERLWLALAAYNVGFGHLMDAKSLIPKDLEKNWKHVSEALPKLSQSQFFKKLKYGAARGHEPVNYVNRIKNYYEVIKIVSN